VSQDAKDFISKLLTTDPAKRPTAREVRGLQFLKTEAKASEETKEDTYANCFPLLAPILSKLQNNTNGKFEV
jgi:serine/threonine protein kinase